MSTQAPQAPVKNVVIRIEDGEVLNHWPEGGPAELPKEHTVLVAWAESSPGCVYVKVGGVYKKVCF